MKNRKTNRKHSLIITLCLMIAVCAISIGGTLAWLTDITGDVTNTFTTSDIEVTLDESKPAGNTAQMIPGVAIEKDPNVSASSDVDYYVFVQITEENWQDWLTYSVTNAWTQLKDANGNDVTGVYYKEMKANTSLTDEPILVDNKVNVASTLEKEDMEVVDTETGAVSKIASPELSFKAYAIQKANGGTDGSTTYFTPIQAWNQLNSTSAN